MQDTETIDAIRAFNRFYTGRLGLLDRSYLGSGLSVTEMRVLYELMTAGPLVARQLTAALRIDEGYLSRIVKRFEKNGWLIRRPDSTDGRRALLSLSPAGRQKMGPLQQRSRDEIALHLEGLDTTDLALMTEGMAQITAMLGIPDRSEITFRDLAPGDAGWIVSRHGVLYAAHEGYDATFEALVAQLLSEFITKRDPATERAFIPVWNGVRLGSVFVMRDDAETARLRMFYLEPFARNLGLGREMLELVIDHARDTGAGRLLLWTHESHRAACVLYKARGFTMTDTRPSHAFGQKTVEQVWELGL